MEKVYPFPMQLFSLEVVFALGGAAAAHKGLNSSPLCKEGTDPTDTLALHSIYLPKMVWVGKVLGVAP